MKLKLITRVAFTILTGSLIAFAGCDRGGQAGAASGGDAAPRVGVVDLAKVAQDMGWSSKLNTNLGTYQNQLKNELLRYRSLYQQQLVENRRQMAPKDSDQLTQAQQEALTQMIATATQQYGSLEQQAGQQYQNYQNDSIRRMREALGPIVRQVAQEKKVVFVVTPTDTLIYSDPAIDLTNSVFDAARKQPPAITDALMTPLEPPKGIPVTVPSATQPSTAATTRPTTRP